MKVNIALNGKTAELDVPDEKLVELGLMEKKKPTGYGRVPHGRSYYNAGSIGKVFMFTEDGCDVDERWYSSGNYYSNEEVAEANARAEKLMRQLRRFAAENGGIPSVEDWKNERVSKYYIYTRSSTGRTTILSGESYITRDTFQIYFISEEACDKAIKLYKDELTWYFTEYQAMLY